MTLDYIDHLARECARFGDVLREAPPSAPVPTCPEWTADDLLWHVAGVVFDLWTAIVRVREIEKAKALPNPDRPDTHAVLFEFWLRRRDDMIEALGGVDDAEPMWTWSSDHTAGWIKRRMAHELLIHRVDAELTVADRSPIDPSLAADGVHEVLQHFYGNRPEWASWDGGAPNGPVGRVAAVDTNTDWTFQLGALSGTDPDGRHYAAEPGVLLRNSGEPASFTVRGSAADLDLWLWHRPTVGEIAANGSAADFEQMKAMVDAGI